MIPTRNQFIPVPFTEEYRPDLLGGVTVIHGKRYAIDETSWQDELYREEAPTEREVEITAVPYCVWDNRTPGQMRVWLRAPIGNPNGHDPHHPESG